MKHNESIRQAHLDRMVLSTDVPHGNGNLRERERERERTSASRLKSRTQHTHKEAETDVFVGEDDAPVAVQGGLEGEGPQPGAVL